jgi:hypothetical protein
VSRALYRFHDEMFSHRGITGLTLGIKLNRRLNIMQALWHTVAETKFKRQQVIINLTHDPAQSFAALRGCNHHVALENTKQL